jgi:CheY-like chemotaxis protein
MEITRTFPSRYAFHTFNSRTVDVPNVKGIGGGDWPTGRRVLVVEDGLDSLHTLVSLISMMGHECQFTVSGFAALKIAREFRPEIILLDIGLPDYKGYDIARHLRYQPGLEHTRIIAMTALPEDTRQHAMDAGCDEFYRKPMDPQLLEELLSKRFGAGTFPARH